MANFARLYDVEYITTLVLRTYASGQTILAMSESPSLKMGKRPRNIDNFTFISFDCCRAAMVVQGVARVDNSFVQSLIEFNTGGQTQLNFVTDLDFYDEVLMCLQMVSTVHLYEFL